MYVYLDIVVLSFVGNSQVPITSCIPSKTKFQEANPFSIQPTVLC